MNYSYMKHHYGDNCFYGDTSYKRYARYHMPRASVNIFNVGGGGCYNTHHCCGGGWFGGGNFWSGLGLGLGAGLGNMFMGGLNMLGGWLGGMGFGMPSFGYGNLTPFGLGTSASDGSRRRKARKDDSDLKPQTVNDGKKTDTTGKTKNTENDGNAQDKDYKKITAKITELKTSLPEVNIFDKTSVDTYNQKVEEAISALKNYGELDGILDDTNRQQIENGKDLLEKLKKEYVDPTKVAQEGYSLKLKNNDHIVINKDTELTPDIIDAITDSNEALAVLAAIGELHYDRMSTDYDHYHEGLEKTTHYVCGHLSTNQLVMKLYEKANIAVEVLKGGNSNGIKDHWYVGTVSEINTDGSFSFELNCKDNGIAKGKYKVTIKDDKTAEIKQQGENGSWKTINSGTEYDELNRLLKAGPKTTQQQ